MNLHTDKDLKSKTSVGKKLYIFAWKRSIFWVNFKHLCPKGLDSFTKYFLFTKYFDSEKISLFTLLRAEINGGAIMTPTSFEGLERRRGAVVLCSCNILTLKELYVLLNSWCPHFLKVTNHSNKNKKCRVSPISTRLFC